MTKERKSYKFKIEAIPPLPIDYVFAETKSQAKRKAVKMAGDCEIIEVERISDVTGLKWRLA